MERFVRIAVLEDEIVAQMLTAELTARNVPHRLRTYRDSALNGLFQGAKGWGHIEAQPEHEKLILEIIEQMGTTES